MLTQLENAIKRPLMQLYNQWSQTSHRHSCVCIYFMASSNDAEKESKNLSAVSKAVNKEVDAAVDTQKNMSNKKNLRTYGNVLKLFLY